MTFMRPGIPALAAMLLAAPALSQTQNPQSQTAPAVRTTMPGQMARLAPDELYQGWRARQLIGQQVSRKGGETIGIVRDLIIDGDGRLAALMMEGGGTLGIPDAVYRIPWSEVDLTPGRDGVAADLADGGGKPQYGLFPGSEGVPTLPREFRLTEILGDYARLQTGHGYGYVTDAVFEKDGRLIAVLVSRDKASGGGTYAFAFPGDPGRWDPGASYYGLPFVTPSQAETAGLRIAPDQFKGAGL